jgi:hypothetical protein
MTMDLETRSINGVLSVYLASIYKEYKVISFYLNDYKYSTEY